jgi:hypothetical protein
MPGASDQEQQRPARNLGNDPQDNRQPISPASDRQPVNPTRCLATG